MNTRDTYTPGPATAARVQKEGDSWTLVITKDFKHAPEEVWRALTEPEQLRQWAPFDADGNLDKTGAKVKLTTVGAPQEQVTDTTISRAEAPKVLEYAWGGGQLRWELEPEGDGTHLTLWHQIDRRFIGMGAAGWHLCLDVLGLSLDGHPIGRIVANDALQFEGWQRLNKEYSEQFGVEPMSW
jgi:uncharacterized protein YndB with AHSA1/START domain